MAHNKVTSSPKSPKSQDTKTLPVTKSTPVVALSIQEANDLTLAWYKMESLDRLISHAGEMFDGGQGVCDVAEFLGPIVKSIQPFIDMLNERRTQAEADARTGAAK